MTVLESGEASTVLATIESTHKALRVTQRPQEVGARGSYSASFYTGVIPAALAANGELFQFRWAPATTTFLCIIRSVKISVAISTTAMAAGVPQCIELRVARAWTAQGTLGTGITFGTNDAKKRTSFATTALAANDVRIATTAALGGGTKTLDGVAHGTIAGQSGTAIATIIPAETPLWTRDTGDEYPIVLANQEGIVVRTGPDAFPATGTWKLAVHIEWSEIDPATVTGW